MDDEYRGGSPQRSPRRPLRRAVSFAVTNARGKVLLVRRPLDDEDQPGLWGLPAATLRPGEEWEAALRRGGREKLGVRLVPRELLREGKMDRGAYILHMRLYRAEVEGDGLPCVPQPYPGTQYVETGWVSAQEAAQVLRVGAARGSLCSRLYLEALGTGEAGHPLPPDFSSDPYPH